MTNWPVSTTAMPARAGSGTLLGHGVAVLPIVAERPVAVMLRDGTMAWSCGGALESRPPRTFASGKLFTNAIVHVLGLDRLGVFDAVAAVLGFAQAARRHLVALGEEQRRKKQDGEIMFWPHLSRVCGFTWQESKS